MKKIIFTLLLILHSFTSFCQEIIHERIEDENLPFAIIEEIPVFPGCEEIERKERMNCFQNQIINHIKTNFNYPKEALNKSIQGRVNVEFIINKEGDIEHIFSRGPSGTSILEKEATRIISLLPKMKPGTQKGKPVNVRYVVPISFKLH
jgi:protein TonB